MMQYNDGDVVGGVDTHLQIHVVAAVDHIGRILATESFPTTTAGYRQLLRWLQRHGRLVRVGVEGTGSYGAGLTRHLKAEGVDVVEVNRPDRQRRRLRGKSDTVDAEAAAPRSAGTTPGGRTGQGECQIPAERSHGHLPGDQTRSSLSRTPLRSIDYRDQRTRQCDHCFMHPNQSGIDRRQRSRPRSCRHAARCCWRQSRTHAFRSSIRRVVRSSSHRSILRAHHPTPTEPRREPPGQQRVVADRDGSSVHRHSHKAYVARRTSDGKTKREIIRCLQRFVAREIHSLLTKDHTTIDGADLRAQRQASDLRLEDASQALNTWPIAISRLERGLTHNTDLATNTGSTNTPLDR